MRMNKYSYSIFLSAVAIGSSPLPSTSAFSVIYRIPVALSPIHQYSPKHRKDYSPSWLSGNSHHRQKRYATIQSDIHKDNNHTSSTTEDTTTDTTESDFSETQPQLQPQQTLQVLQPLPTPLPTPLLAYGVPSYKTLLLFVGTTILILLSEPLLSLVDTTIVGQTATVVQLAALGPATMLIDSCLYLTYFLAISTTNTMATNIAKGDYQNMVKTSSQVLSVAAACGALVTLICVGFGRPLLHWMAGASATPELLHLGLQYACIRSAVAPLAIMGMVAQSICLACLDTLTPAVAVAMASIVNVVGDILLVPHMGVVGAAVATAVASVASTAILVRQVVKKMNIWNEKIPLVTIPEEQTTATLPMPMAETKKVATISFFQQPWAYIKNIQLQRNKSSTSTYASASASISYLSWPDNASLLQLVKLAGPIFFVIVGKIICYSAMNLRATGFGLTALATHNIMMRIFFFYATFGDSLSQASQTFVPQVLVGSQNNQQQVKKLLTRLSVMATAIGIMNTNVARFIIQNCGTYFTKEPSILSTMAGHSTYLCLALLLHPFIMLFEGAIIATKDLGYLVGTYVYTMILLMGLLAFSSTTFQGVWRALFIFQVIRLVQFAHRVRVKMVVPSKEQTQLTTTVATFAPTSL